MSEYQYYEFRAIDHPLTYEQRGEVSALSSRAYVTSHSASFVYNYGDFRGDTEQLMSDYFDVMLYVANWGSRRLMFRIPYSIIDTEQVRPYCISEELEQRKTQDEKHVIVDLGFHDEDQAGWAEGEGWLDDLVELREELIQGDFRVLYLAWLKAAVNALAMEDIDKGTLEPPVPPGLGQLSSALKTFVRFLEIDEDMIEVAARESAKRQKQQLEPETWVKKLVHAEQYDFLVRLSRNEKNLSALLNRRLHQLAGKTLSEEKRADAARRTIKALIDGAETCRREKEEQEKRKAELARQRKLEDLASREGEVWVEVAALIEEKKAKAYDRAVGLLQNLCDLYRYQGDVARFRTRLADIEKTYSSRSGLLRRIRDAKLS